MIDIELFFNQYRAHAGYASDKQMAKALGLSTAYLCDIKKGRRRLSDALALTMAKPLNLDPGELLLQMRVTYAAQAEEKLAWKRIMLQWQKHKDA
ncbi:helix-turn-helix domain-containing protein [Paraferrimonas sedimenticola]|uniref:HTH cro/C1-type domain-containing protein n=1 Tax=Paraferrimonas sedimenticola TaxID=375674 RepID=A0AA37W184_9GAMM|nr:helix-turn-helix transcriptional regulator [Paraferrimonas sedimenticola]GLP96012.1 hypothetical protein GCM10007895_13180 [Paraferrimonas sedimenticola]